MKLEGDNVLLWLHPKTKDEKPCFDDLSRKILYALQTNVKEGCIGYPAKTKAYCDKHKKKYLYSITTDMSYLGTHVCTGCKEARSSARDYAIVIPDENGVPQEWYTNYLAYHYVVHHRSECPEKELAVINRIKIPNNFVSNGKFEH